MGQVAEAFLGRGAIPLPRQRMRALEELLEQSRTSKGVMRDERFDYTSRKLCGVQPPRNAGFPGREWLAAT
jgi:hypothetical protein